MYREGRHHLQEEDLSFSTHDVTGSQFWKNVYHHERAEGLITIRQQRGWTPNLTLDKAVRRQLVGQLFPENHWTQFLPLT